MVDDAIRAATIAGMSYEQRLRAFYAAHNGRDADALVAQLHEDVAWPNSWKGGFLRGHAAVVGYWRERWPQLEGTVEPTAISEREDGRVAVVVEQLVRDLDGTVVAQGPATHVFTFADDLILTMDVEPAPAS